MAFNRPHTSAFKPGIHYHTEWLLPEAIKLSIEELNIDKIYENLIWQIAGGRLDNAESEIKEAVSRDEQRQKLIKEISTLEKKVQQEKQFNR